jgi:hypothetical protein
MALATHSAPTSYERYVATTQAPTLGKRICTLANALERDLGHAERKHPLADIREIRRFLNTLEYELKQEIHDVHGEAC